MKRKDQQQPGDKDSLATCQRDTAPLDAPADRQDEPSSAGTGAVRRFRALAFCQMKNRVFKMDVQVLRRGVAAIESQLAGLPGVVLADFRTNDRLLHLVLTDRLRMLAKKEGVWKSREFAATLKNAAYGFGERRSRCSGGRDGIFLVDRNYRPRNAMMLKLLDHYMDKAGSGIQSVAKWLGVKVDDLRPVRLVSHHMRLLGVLSRQDDADWLVLVDCDRTES